MQAYMHGSKHFVPKSTGISQLQCRNRYCCTLYLRIDHNIECTHRRRNNSDKCKSKGSNVGRKQRSNKTKTRVLTSDPTIKYINGPIDNLRPQNTSSNRQPRPVYRSEGRLQPHRRDHAHAKESIDHLLARWQLAGEQKEQEMPVSGKELGRMQGAQ